MSKRSSRSSVTTRTSQSSDPCFSWDLHGPNARTPSEEIELDLNGLPENAVDSEDEDAESCPSGDSFLDLRDTVRECLERDPKDRNDDDIQILYEFMQHMPSFADLPQSVKREFCSRMVFAVVDRAGTVVMEDGERLDSWYNFFK